MGLWYQKFRLRFPALLLLVATVSFWSLYERYEPVGPVLLDSPPLEATTITRGKVSENKGTFILAVSGESGTQARVDFPLPPVVMEHERLRVSGRIKLEGVLVGKHPWNCARLLVAQYDASNKWIPGHHFLIAEKGTREWAGYDDVFVLHPDAARVAVVLQQSGRAGIAQFKQIQAQPVRLRTSFAWWRGLFGIAWLAVALLYFTRCRLHSRRLRILILLNVLAILAGTLMPEEWILSGMDKAELAVRELRPRPAERVSQPLAEQVPPPKADVLKRQMDWVSEVEVEPHVAGHFFLFATLCFLVYLSAALERQHPVYFVKVGFDVLLFAAITESLQLLTLDRTAGLADLRTDLYGMGLALALFIICLPILRRHMAKPA
jgi:VanZ family protein